MKLTQFSNPTALRLDTTVGTRIFAGNTMIFGDTGQLSTNILLGASPGGFQANLSSYNWIQRTNYTTQLCINVTPPEIETNGVIFTLPVGFRPNVEIAAILGSAASSGKDVFNILIRSNGDVARYGPRSSNLTGKINGTIMWTNAPGWPTTLPI